MKLLVRNGTIVTGEGSFAADLMCTDGVITHIVEPGSAQIPADEVIDAAGLLVFPGFIDPHVHSRDPGQTEKEDFAHSTLAALASGLTTVLEMPNAVPPVVNADTFEERATTHARTAHVDFGLWGLSLGHENAADLVGLYEAGAVGIKIFWGYALDREQKRLVYNTADLPAERVIPPPDLSAVLAVLENAAKVGGLVAAHCEDATVLKHALERVGEITTYDDLLSSRPGSAEATSVAIAVQLAKYARARFHVLHVASQEVLPLVRRARQDGLSITAETCPHYLCLTQDFYGPETADMKVYPPVRAEADRLSLWEAINEGTIQSVSSDHAPHAIVEKRQPLGSQPAGMHGIETLVPLMLDKMAQGVLSAQTLARVLSENTADLYGIGHRKGRIRVGGDADLTLVDPEQQFTIDQDTHHTLHRRSVFHGRRGRGVAVASILRGQELMRNGEPVDVHRRGELIRSSLSRNVPQTLATMGGA